MRLIRIAITVSLLLLAPFTPDLETTTASAQSLTELAWPIIDFTRVTGELSRPVHITHAGDDSGRLFVAEQGGTIQILKNGQLAGTFLDINGSVRSPGDLGAGNEEGLLSIAFPPGYAQKGHFYVYYTNNAGNNQVSRFRISSNPDIADPNSEQRILLLEHPINMNHNGGQLVFGPDGYLYIGTGDGGGAGDPNENAQNLYSLLGKLLRIDVESGPGGGNYFEHMVFIPTIYGNGIGGGALEQIEYRIPQDNPYANGSNARPEIWALGLRNPWRFSFDRLTGDLFIGDVGQQKLEEINFQPTAFPGGANYGWNILEGNNCFEPSTGCSQPTGYSPPVITYSHTENNPDGCNSITGGFVYHGQEYAGLKGIYFFADFCSGKIWGAQQEAGTWKTQLLQDTTYWISSFGQDQGGELYLLDMNGGTVYRIREAQ